MSERPVTRPELTEELDDFRADQGVVIARFYQDWERVLDLKLQAHTARLEKRQVIALAAAVGLLKFDLPNEVTAAAIGVVALKLVWGLFASSS